jgi:hypothetical protein
MPSRKITMNDRELTEFLTEAFLEGRTYTDVGNELGVSTERIRQLKNRLKIQVDPMTVRQRKRTEQQVAKGILKYGPAYLDEDLMKSDLFERMRLKFSAFKRTAKNRGKKVTVTFADLEFPQFCPVLGLELDYFTPVRLENSVSFDCLNPDKDYVKGNVAVMSWRANRIKNDGNADEHLKIHEYLTKLGI